MQTLLQFYPNRWNRQLVWIEEVKSLFLNLCWHSSMSHTCHRYQWVKKWLDAKRGTNHIITIGHHNHFWGFYWMRMDFVLILLILNMFIHLNFFLVQLLFISICQSTSNICIIYKDQWYNSKIFLCPWVPCLPVPSQGLFTFRSHYNRVQYDMIQHAAWLHERWRQTCDKKKI